MTETFMTEAPSIADDIEALDKKGKDGYSFAMEWFLTAEGCSTCLAEKASSKIKQKAIDEGRRLSSREKGKLMACEQIRLIGHRCERGALGYGFRARKR